MVEPLHEIVLKAEIDGFEQQKKAGVFLLEADYGQLNGLRVKRYGEGAPFWDLIYLFPYGSSEDEYVHESYRGLFYAVVPEGLELVAGDVKVHTRHLIDDELKEVADRVLITCGTRTTYYQGHSIPGGRAVDLWPEFKDDKTREGMTSGQLVRVLFPYRQDNYRSNDPAVYDNIPEARGCRRLGTRAIQIVNPQLFKELELDGWTITYLCPEHAAEYIRATKASNLVQDVDINNGVTEMQQGHHRHHGTWMNTAVVFPSRLHVIDTIHHFLLTHHIRTTFRAPYAAQADATPRIF